MFNYVPFEKIYVKLYTVIRIKSIYRFYLNEEHNFHLLEIL